MAANGMGNTTNVPITIAASPPVNVGGSVHNVHNTSNPISATSTERKEEKADDLLHAQVHKSSRVVPGQKDAADRAGGSTSLGGLSGTNWNEMADDDDDMYDADDVSQHDSRTEKATGVQNTSLAPSTAATTAQSQNVFDRVPTPAHPILETTATVPPFPAAHKDDASRFDEDGKPVAGSFDMKWITIRVDMRSHSSHFRSYGLPKGRSNNLTSLRRVLFRASELTKVSFTPSEMFVGMDKGKVDLSYLSKEEMAKLQEQIKTTAAVAAGNGSGLDSSSLSSSLSPTSSSSSSSTLSFWSHQFRLHFDTVTNTKKAYASLSAMRLSPRVPSPRTITGIVYGFGFTSTNERITQQMQQHAWYEGGAPSAVITRRMQPMSRLHMFDVPQPCDGSFFSVAASEFPKFLLIPSLNSSRPITVERYTRSKTVVCYHCNQAGHIGSACASKEMKNAMSDVRDACIMCGSFDHIHASCPARDDPNATCIICKTGKHTVRACPKYKGTYKKVTPRLNNNNIQQQQTRTRAWGTQNTVGIITGQQSRTQAQTTTQTTTNTQNARQQQQQRANNTHIAQQDKMIAFLQAQHVAQQKSIDSLTEQVAILTRLLTAHMIQNNNINSQPHGSVVHADDTTKTETEMDGTATTTATTTAKKAASKKKMNKPTQAINKAQNDITKGTPRVSTFFAPTPTFMATDTNTTTRKANTHDTKETDMGATENDTTPEVARHTLLPRVTGNKRRAVDENTEEEKDALVPPATASTPTLSTTSAGKKTRK